MNDLEDRERSLVPSPILTETGVVCLTSERSAEDVTMYVVGSPRVDDKNAGDGIFNGGDSSRDES